MIGHQLTIKSIGTTTVREKSLIAARIASCALG
jgi:hypothetical protein